MNINYEKINDKFTQVVAQADITGNQSLSTIFGDQVFATRVPFITAQFGYGLRTGNTNPKEDDATITQLNGATVSIVESELLLTSGTNSAAHAAIQSNQFVRYIPGFEMYVLFTYSFAEPEADSLQIAGLYDSNDGFGVGYNGLQFSFFRRKGGETFTYPIDISTINNGNFDPKNFNIYFLKYGFLGVAPAKMYGVKSLGSFFKVFEMPYAGLYDTIHTDQTFLPLRAEILKTGGTTNMVNKVGSVSAGIIDGSGMYPGTRRFSFDLGSHAILAGTTVLGVFRNKTTYNGKENRIQTKLLSISAATETNKPVKYIILRNPTITAAGTFADADTGSVMEYSTNTTINTATGKPFIIFNLSKSGQLYSAVENQDIILRAGEWAAIMVSSTGAGDIEYSMRWEEQF